MDNIRIFLANRKKYEEGTLVGEWITLPIDFDEQAEFFERIGVEEDPCGIRSLPTTKQTYQMQILEGIPV